MKLRIRFQNRRELVEVSNPECTLLELIRIVGGQFSLTESSFGLSLDGKTLLPTDENTTLSALGIVGGDLLHVLQNNITDSSSSSSELSSSVPVSQSVTSHGISSKLVNIEEPSTSGIGPSSLKQNNIKSETKEICSIKGNESIDFKTQSTGGKDIEHQRAGPSNVITEQKQRKLEYTPKVLLCRDGMPYSLQSSYEIATVVTMHQAVCVAVHVLMLETGFVNYSSEANEPPNKEPSASSHDNNVSTSGPIISQNWKTDSGARFLYSHPACPGLVCSVVCSSLGPYVLAHGMSNSPSCNEVHQCRLCAADFVKGNVDLKSSSAVDVYKNLQRLSMAVKDQIAYPLLSSMRHELNLEEIYGYMALPTEVKLMVLCLLPVKDILQISATCRELQTITNDNILWQHLCFRDFGLLSKGRYTTWKMEYKRRYKDYLERRRDNERMTFVVPGQGIYPPMFPDPHPPFAGMPGIYGGRHDMFPNVPFMPGGINPGTLPTPGNLPRPRFDPFGPLPDMDINPGPNRRRPGRGRGRGGFPPGPFF